MRDRTLAVAVVCLLNSVEGLRLEVEELEIVRALVPLVLFVVVAGAWLSNILFVNIEAIGDTEVQIVRHESALDDCGLQALRAVEQATSSGLRDRRVALVQVAARANFSRSRLVMRMKSR